VDTPGILEAGPEGQNREQLARQQAAQADLLLLVVDGDLRAAEYAVFEALASLGKRLILVLNKCDLRGEDEERRLLGLLLRRTAGRIASDDVVAASAAFKPSGVRPVGFGTELTRESPAQIRAATSFVRSVDGPSAKTT
jgi:GTPase Era involved in 16S rRNA processing